jgi:hypothetical protein
MRTIISNDLSRLYGRIDYNLLEKTKLSTKVLSSATALPVLNSSGFSVNDYICLNDPGKEQSEVRQISSVSGQTINISTPTSFNNDNKTNIYRMEYDAIKFFGDSSVVATVSIKPDYLVSVGATIENSVAYSMSFYNTTTSSETAKGEAVYATDKLLCSESDVAKYESIEILGSKIIDKIDIASRDIRNMFRSQKQNIKDVDDRELLRSACALSTLRYIFLELTKTGDDTPSQKSTLYTQLYDNEIRRIMEVINVEDDNVRVMGQTRATR